MLAFGRHLRSLRQEAGLTMEELAYRCGLSYTQLARIELGQINTTISTVFALARGLTLSPPELFTFDLPPSTVNIETT